MMYKYYLNILMACIISNNNFNNFINQQSNLKYKIIHIFLNTLLMTL